MPEAPVPSPILGNAPPASAPASIGRTTGPVALLLPLSGPLAPLGQALENAAKLALSGPGAPALDIRDTQGNPQAAAQAAQAAIAAGDGLILGPLTSAETKAVAPIAAAAGVNVLAFTNDGTAASPGVWPLGITPGEQVRRVIGYAADQGRTRVAALLPQSDYGQSLGQALREQTQSLSEPAPDIAYYQGSFASLTQTVKSLSDFADRGESIEAEIRKARDQDNQAGRLKARELERQPIPPPPFDALFIAANGETLAEIGTLLPYYDAGAPQVQLLGPSLWAGNAAGIGTQSALRGALYAAPDPASRAAFAAKYQSVYGTPPPAVADVAFDAAAIARLASGQGGYTTEVLTNPSGFAGTDGVLVLLANGHVMRGLAVFKIQSGGPEMVAPSPTSLSAPAS
jgi:outer membrane PBP1 activator LpoA protein